MQAITHLMDVFLQYSDYFLEGTKNTLLLSFFGVLIGIVLGSFISVLRQSKIKLIHFLAQTYIELFRCTPLTVQILLVYIGYFVIVGHKLPAFLAGILTVSANSAAYVAEIIRSGINAIDKGQTEAARSLGLSPHQTLRYIIYPQAFKNILPALANEFITVIKETSIVFTIGVHELMFNTNVVTSASYDPFSPVIISAGIYFIITFTLSKLVGFWERRWNAHA